MTKVQGSSGEEFSAGSGAPSRRPLRLGQSLDIGPWTLGLGHCVETLALAFLLLALPCPVVAHDSPEHVIDLLSARMETIGERPDLLWRRATEHRALGNLNAAAADLQRAVKLRKDYQPALIDLSRVRLAQGRRRDAMKPIERALAFVTNETSRAPIRMMKAEILAAAGDHPGALRECDLALASSSSVELDWYLTRSQLQCQLGRFAEAAEGLRQGYERTGSAVLEVESIDAMIDAAQHDDAWGKVESALRETRWRSSWLIRRARIHLGRANISAAHQDFAEAIVEINRRLNPAHPEVSLLADRGLALALLGDRTSAKKDLLAARKAGADAAMLRRLENALAAHLPTAKRR